MEVAPPLYKTCRVTLLYSAYTSGAAKMGLEQKVGAKSWEWSEVGDTPLAVLTSITCGAKKTVQ